MNEGNEERHGPDDAEILIHVKVFLICSLDILRISKGKGAWDSSPKRQRQLIHGSKRTNQLDWHNLIDHLGTDNRKSAIGDTPNEATDTHEPNILADEGNTDTDAKDHV